VANFKLLFQYICGMTEIKQEHLSDDNPKSNPGYSKYKLRVLTMQPRHAS